MISFTDNTRATPNERIIPWLLEALGDHPRDQIVLINQLGTHRPNTRTELEEMLTPEVVANYEVINHDCENDAELVTVGEMNDGTPATVNRRVVEADLRIITGFIEPHFFAGFSGGPKGIIPGCAGLKTIQASHNVRNIGHPQASFGITDGNPLWEELLRVALSIGPSFLVNVSLTHDRRITGVYTGDLREAHRQGCRDVKAKAMTPTPESFDVVVTTNSGYPLDRNLYQGVKGMSAAARIVKDGGTIVLACECGDGVPDGSPFDLLLRESSSPADILVETRHSWLSPSRAMAGPDPGPCPEPRRSPRPFPFAGRCAPRRSPDPLSGHLESGRRSARAGRSPRGHAAGTTHHSLPRRSGGSPLTRCSCSDAVPSVGDPSAVGTRPLQIADSNNLRATMNRRNL